MARSYSYLGITYPTLRQFILENMAKDKDLNYDLVASRLANNWDVNDALNCRAGTCNPNLERSHEYNGRFYPTKEALIVANMHPTLTYRGVSSRLYKGWSLKDALETPLILNKRKGRSKGKSLKKGLKNRGSIKGAKSLKKVF